MDNVDIIGKWSLLVALGTSVIGGSAWLTTTHNAVKENTREVRLLEEELKDLAKENGVTNGKLGRIEEKIDFILKLSERRIGLQQ